MEKKMDDLKKAKLIYSGELILIAIVALIIGILELTNIIKVGHWFIVVFTWVTILLAPAMLIDNIYVLAKPERREKANVFDRCTLIPIYIYLIIIDFITLMNALMMPQAYHQITIGILILSVACIYILQGCYHWYHPLPALIKAIEEDQKAKAKPQEDIFEEKAELQEEMLEEQKQEEEEKKDL